MTFAGSISLIALGATLRFWRSARRRPPLQQPPSEYRDPPA